MAKSTAPVTADDTADELVVFLIGMTFNKPWKVRSWFPVFTGMPKMLRELGKDPDSGLLSYRLLLGARGPMVVQYWESAEKLDAYARGKGNQHTKSWAAFYKRVVKHPGDVGIWHETYVTGPGQRESLYHATPNEGLAAALGGFRDLRHGEETGAKRRAGSGASPAHA